MIIGIPDDRSWMEKRKIFYSMGANLFSYLRTAIGNKEGLEFGQLYERLDTWRTFARSLDTDQGQEFSPWQIMHGLLWCAQQASEKSNSGVDMPESVRSNPAWARDCIRLLRNEDMSVHSLDVPMVVSNPRTGAGYVFSLNLDVLYPGSGEVFHHPMDVLMTSPSRDFRESMMDAWDSARSLINMGDSPYDGRWRVLDRYKRPILEAIDGKSASGAAARGWWYGLQRKMPNDGVVIMAQADGHGNLMDVTGVREKTQAVADSDSNTIILVSEDRKKQVQDILKGCNKADIKALSVEPSQATLESLVTVTEIVVSGRIDGYSPDQLIQVEVDQLINLSITFTNTGNTTWEFIAEADFFDTNWSSLAGPKKAVRLDPGQQATVELQSTIHRPGDYWVQYYIWRGRPFDKHNLLDRQPTPSEHFITVVPPQAS